METSFRGKKIRFKEPIIPERIRRLRQVCDYSGHEYKNNKTEDKWELQTSIYAQKYPDQVQRELTTLIRVKLPMPGQFEIDEKGTIDNKHQVKEALVYTVHERVTDPSNLLTKVLSSCSHKMGVYQRPLFLEEKDDFGNVTESKIHSLKNMFYIKFEPETVKKVLEEFNYEYRNTVLAIAIKGGGDSWYGSHTYSIFNLDEWLHSSFDDALGANQAEFLKDKATGRVVEHGAVEKYIINKQEKKEKAEREFKEFREMQQNQQQERGRGKK